MRFRITPSNYEETFVNFSKSESARGKMNDASVCEHLAGFKIHDVNRNLTFDVCSNPTLHGSGNGSVENMLLHNKLIGSLEREGGSGISSAKIQSY